MQTQRKEINFNGVNVYCGIDLHKKTWSVTVEVENTPFRKSFSQPADKEALVHYLHNNYPGANYCVAYEAGYFGFGLHRYLESQGITCCVLHPADIPTTHKEKDQKRDKLDSKKITRSLRTETDRAIWVPKVYQEQDRQLLRVRRSKVKDQTRTQNRIKSFLQINAVPYPESFLSSNSGWSKRFIDWLEKIEFEETSAKESLRVYIEDLLSCRSSVLKATQAIRVLSQSERYNKAYNKIISITGIGPIVGMTLLTEIVDIKRFKNTDKFSSFIGLIPSSHSSGEKDYQGRITPRANSHLRSLLIQSAWRAISSSEYFCAQYTSYRKKMPANKAIVRVARKLANHVYYVLKIESKK
jgi:transposase